MEDKWANSQRSRLDAATPGLRAGGNPTMKVRHFFGKSRCEILAILFLPAALACPSLCGAATIGFEQGEGFAPGADVAAKAGWAKSAAGTAKVSATEAQSGSQSLEIPASKIDRAASTGFAIPGNGIVFIDFAIRPTADASTAPSGIVDANGAVIGFLKNQDKGSVAAVTSPAKSEGISNSVDTGFTFPLDEQGRAANWIRVTVREDLTAQKWDLFLDGKLTLIEQPLHAAPPVKSNTTGSLAIYSSPAGSSFVDDLFISGVNPLFVDTDRDGIPDVEEKALGMNPQVDDRQLRNTRGITNISEFLAESSQPSSVSGKSIIYVDNTFGDDRNTGEMSYSQAKRGPKGTIKAAMDETNGDITIAVSESAKSYRMPLMNRTDRSITFTPIGNITIQN